MSVFPKIESQIAVAKIKIEKDGTEIQLKEDNFHILNISKLHDFEMPEDCIYCCSAQKSTSIFQGIVHDINCFCNFWGFSWNSISILRN